MYFTKQSPLKRNYKKSSWYQTNVWNLKKKKKKKRQFHSCVHTHSNTHTHTHTHRTEGNTQIGILLIVLLSNWTATSESLTRSGTKSNQPAIYTEPAQLKQKSFHYWWKNALLHNDPTQIRTVTVVLIGSGQNAELKHYSNIKSALSWPHIIIQNQGTKSLFICIYTQRGSIYDTRFCELCDQDLL